MWNVCLWTDVTVKQVELSETGETVRCAELVQMRRYVGGVLDVMTAVGPEVRVF